VTNPVLSGNVREGVTGERKVSPDMVFVVGPDVSARSYVHSQLDRLGYTVIECEGVEDVLGRFQDGAVPAGIFVDMPFEREKGDEMLASLISRVDPVPVVVVSPDSNAEAIVSTMRRGASDYVVRPFQDGELARSISNVLSGRRSACRPPGPGSAAQPTASRPLIASPAMKVLDEMVQRIADSDLTVLICGESGSGKEVVARHIHHSSARRGNSFVKVNCAALPDELLESELFGYEKGAFTGASSMKPGRFESAHRGTILLDEITEMSTRLQAKLLHFLQDKQFIRLGGNHNIHVDARVLAASNSIVESDVEKGRFRQDLYYRLKGIDLYVPPLRERREEIPLFVNHFLHRFAEQYRRPVPRLSERFHEVLLGYHWHGNVRELENLIKRVVILGDERSALREIVSRSGRETAVSKDAPSTSSDRQPAQSDLSLKEVSRRAAMAAERELIARVLEQTRWNRRKASEILKVSYKTLLNKMKEVGLGEE
jgi:two-component system response regulator AtoC